MDFDFDRKNVSLVPSPLSQQTLLFQLISVQSRGQKYNIDKGYLANLIYGGHQSIPISLTVHVFLH